MQSRRQVLKAGAVAAAALGGLNAHAVGKKRVALVMTGTITDGGWNQSAYDGLQQVGKMGGFETAYTENVTQAKIPEVVSGYADDGFDLIIGHGFEFGSAFVEIAPEFKKQSFFASTFKPQDNVPANARYIDLAYFEAAYGAGALAALISEKGRAVGFVGGGDNPTQQRIKQCFVFGAEKTRPGLVANGVVTGDYDNAARGKEAAETMIANGADVIWHAANVTGLGAIQAAVASRAKVIGCYADQAELAPDNMATSLVLNLDWMVVEVAKTIADGSFRGGEEWAPRVTHMWSPKFGKVDHNAKVASAEAWAGFTQIWKELGDKKIDVAKLVP